MEHTACGALAKHLEGIMQSCKIQNKNPVDTYIAETILLPCTQTTHPVVAQWTTLEVYRPLEVLLVPCMTQNRVLLWEHFSPTTTTPPILVRIRSIMSTLHSQGGLYTRTPLKHWASMRTTWRCLHCKTEYYIMEQSQCILTRYAHIYIGHTL